MVKIEVRTKRITLTKFEAGLEQSNTTILLFGLSARNSNLSQIYCIPFIKIVYKNKENLQQHQKWNVNKTSLKVHPQT